MQTSYQNTMNPAFAGMAVDNRESEHESGVLEGAAAVPFGLALVRGSSAAALKLPSSAADLFIGVGRHTHSYFNQDLSDTAGIPVSGPVNAMRKGEMYVLVEDDVAEGDPAFYRITANSPNLQLGSWRPDNDGVAQVSTLTPTAVNTTLYVLSLLAGGRLFAFEYTSDGSATAAEIVAGFQTAMAADSAFTALVTASGSTTLILTAVAAGEAFSVTSVGPGVMAVAATTPASSRAVAAPGCVFRSAATAGNLAKLEVNLPA